MGYEYFKASKCDTYIVISYEYSLCKDKCLKGVINIQLSVLTNEIETIKLINNII